MVGIAFEKHRLSNGMDVILHEDHTIPLVAVNVWYHVGSKNEEMGRTGFAHLFEHVMFEGTKHHNASHFEPLQKAGANLNGSTTTDRTNYWEHGPSNYLELALWLEADRMGFLLDALDQQRFDVQRDVVKNERRQSYENRPYGMAHWHITEALYPLPHPYHWMTIGSQEDLDAASLDDELVNRYFGDLKPGDPVPRMYRQDSALPGRIELEMRDKVTLPRLYVAYPAPPEAIPTHTATTDAQYRPLQMRRDRPSPNPTTDCDATGRPATTTAGCCPTRPQQPSRCHDQRGQRTHHPALQHRPTETKAQIAGGKRPRATPRGRLPARGNLRGGIVHQSGPHPPEYHLLPGLESQLPLGAGHRVPHGDRADIPHLAYLFVRHPPEKQTEHLPLTFGQ